MLIPQIHHTRRQINSQENALYNLRCLNVNGAQSASNLLRLLILCLMCSGSKYYPSSAVPFCFSEISLIHFKGSRQQTRSQAKYSLRISTPSLCWGKPNRAPFTFGIPPVWMRYQSKLWRVSSVPLGLNMNRFLWVSACCINRAVSSLFDLPIRSYVYCGNLSLSSSTVFHLPSAAS